MSADGRAPLVVLALSGSLRRASSNSALLAAATQLAPAGVLVSRYDQLGDLPLFSPDLEADPPPGVAGFRARLAAADAVLIACPEYAHGVPGAFKNALDWVVGSGELIAKPTGLLNAAPRSTHAQAALRETLTVMMARLVEGACLPVRLPSNQVDEAWMLADPEVAATLRAALDALAAAVASDERA